MCCSLFSALHHSQTPHSQWTQISIVSVCHSGLHSIQGSTVHIILGSTIHTFQQCWESGFCPTRYILFSCLLLKSDFFIHTLTSIRPNLITLAGDFRFKSKKRLKIIHISSSLFILWWKVISLKCDFDNDPNEIILGKVSFCANLINLKWYLNRYLQFLVVCVHVFSFKDWCILEPARIINYLRMDTASNYQKKLKFG